MKKILLSVIALAACVCASAGDWTRMTSVSDILAGGTFIIGYEAEANSGVIVPMQNTGSLSDTAAGFIYSGSEAGKSTASTINMAEPGETGKYEVAVAASTVVDGAVTIKFGDSYLGNTNTKNNAKLFAGEDATTAFTPEVGENDVFTLAIKANEQYIYLQYNANKNSERFAVYGGTQKNVVIYKKTGGAASKQNPALTWSKTYVTLEAGAAFTAPKFTYKTTAAITFSSDNTAVADVDNEGNISLTGSVGVAVITASAPANDDYEAGEAKCTITVNEPEVIPTEVSLPYQESFKSGIGAFTIDDVALGEGLTYVWKHDSSYHYMKASAYNKQNIAAESWLVSPAISLVGEPDATLSFEHCINKYFGDVTTEATVWIKEEGGEWNQLAITYPALQGNWSKFDDPAAAQSIDITAYAGKKVRVGFKYTSTDTAAGTWEIQNVAVTSSSSGISSITVTPKETATYNLAGQRVDASTKGIVVRGSRKFVNR